MTSEPLDLNYLVYSMRNVNVTRVVGVEKTTRLVLAFSFYMNQNLNVKVDTVNNLGQQFAQALEMTWKSKTAGKLPKIELIM